MPSSRAIRSVCDSSAQSAIVTPKPRIALDGVRFV